MKLSFLQSVKDTAKKALAFVTLTTFFAGGIATASATTGPAFNGLPDDFPTLQVANSTQNETSWKASTSASAGDVVSLLVWDHNNVPDTVANNVTLKVNLPTGFNTNHAVTASVSADNAATVIGNANITSSALTNLTYIPGSARFLRNVNGQMAQVNFPIGVNGDNIVTPSGINLGSQQGCWQYAQAVIIQVRVNGGNPDINTNKKVQLAAGSQFADSVTNARPADYVNFRILLENTGTATGTNVKIEDTLDSHLRYVPGSTWLRVKENNMDKDVPVPDSAIRIEGQKITWSFVDMPARADAGFYLNFQARLTDVSTFPVGSTTIQNCAKASFDGVFENTNCVTITVTKSPTPVVNFTLNKEVTNRTLGNSQWYDHALASARPGDRVSYRLSVINTGNTPAQNVTLKDILPTGIAFAGNVKLYNMANPNGIDITGSALVGNGYVFPTITNGNAGYQQIVFDGTITSTCTGNVLLKNRAQVIYNNAVAAEDYADVNISCTRGLIIQKDVKKAGGEYVDQLTSTVREGEILTYRIVVQNNGNTPATNVIVWDNLPAQSTYVANSLAIDGEFVVPAASQQAFFNSAAGLRLTDLTPGLGKTITFQVKVNDCPPLGNILITNTGFAKADGIATISDTARATVEVRKPVFTF